MRYRLRFNLGRGENYMKWQILDTKTGSKKHYDPDEVTIHIVDATLKNNPSSAKRIYDGANKFVCAWVSCNKIYVIPAEDPSENEDFQTPVLYNPRKAPHWVVNGQNADDLHQNHLVTKGRTIYTT